MCEILLTNGMTAQIDNTDFVRVTSVGNWYADESGHGARVYAYRRINKHKIYLHRFILAYDGPLDIDHLDGNGLNCQKVNLKLKTRTANNLNNHNIKSNNKTGVRGVYYDAHYLGYKAEIKVKGRKFNLGVYKTLEEAASARKEAEQRVLSGEHPKPNAKTRGITYVNSNKEDFCP